MKNYRSPVCCLVTIVDRGKGTLAAQLCRSHQGGLQLLALGHGTANAEIMDLLGLDEPEKDVVFSLMTDDAVPFLMADLSAALGLGIPGRGIAFTMPLSGISAAAHGLTDGGALRAALGREKEESLMAQANRFELIFCMAERGMSEEVMAAARTAGASGGTVLRARGLGGEHAQQFLHITIQPEKEVVLILTPAEQKQAIMKAICNEVFTRTGEQGIAFSVPVNDVTGLNLARLTGRRE